MRCYACLGDESLIMWHNCTLQCINSSLAYMWRLVFRRLMSTCSPFELVFGREVHGPLNVLKEGWEAGKRSSESIVSHVFTLREWLESMSELVKEHMGEAQQKQKVWYDHTAKVLLRTSHNKLLAKWLGPYKVICRLGKVNYEVDMPGTRKCST